MSVIPPKDIARKDDVWNRLYAAALPALLRYAIGCVGYEAADDVVVHGAEMAWHHKDRFNPDTGGGGFVKFVATHVRHACRCYLRDLLAQNEVLLPHEEIFRLAERGTPPDIHSLAYDAFRETLYSLLQRIRLTTLQEQCIRLWLDNLAQTDIAKYLGISQPAVSQHISAGVARLRDAHFWETEPDHHVEAFFWECVREATLSVYHRPSGVWDRRGRAGDIERRRQTVTRQEVRP